MTEVYKNGQRLVPMRYKGHGDYVVKGGDVSFAMRAKRGDVIVVKRSLLGLTYKNNAYLMKEDVRSFEPWLERAEVI